MSSATNGLLWRLFSPSHGVKFDDGHENGGSLAPVRLFGGFLLAGFYHPVSAPKMMLLKNCSLALKEDI